MEEPCLMLMENAENLARQMLEVANADHSCCEAYHLLNILGVIRDSAYKIQRVVRDERNLWMTQHHVASTNTYRHD